MKHLPSLASKEKTAELKQYINDCSDKRSVKRAKAILMRLQGKSRREIAFALGINIDTVSNWITFYRQNNIEGLISKPQIGNNFKLSSSQKNNLKKILLLYNPKKLGLPFQSWSLEAVKTLIKKIYNVEYKSNRSYERLLKMISQPNNPETGTEYHNIVTKNNNVLSKLENAKLLISPIAKKVNSIFKRLAKRKENQI